MTYTPKSHQQGILGAVAGVHSISAPAVEPGRLLYSREPYGAVVESSSQDHARHSWTIRDGRAPKQGVHRWPVAVFLRPLHQAYAPLLYQQVAVRARDVDTVGPYERAILAFYGLQWTRAGRILGRMLGAIGGKWTTMNSAAGRSAGSPEASLISAATPPEDAPTTTISRLGKKIPEHENRTASRDSHQIPTSSPVPAHLFLPSFGIPLAGQTQPRGAT
jgi:hypothetical protein